MSLKRTIKSNVIPISSGGAHPENANTILRMRAVVLKMEKVTTSVVADITNLNKQLTTLDEQLQSMSKALSHCDDIYTASLQKLAGHRTHSGNNST